MIHPGQAIAVLAVVSLLVSGVLTRPLARATRPRPEIPRRPASAVQIATTVGSS